MKKKRERYSCSCSTHDDFPDQHLVWVRTGGREVRVFTTTKMLRGLQGVIGEAPPGSTQAANSSTASRRPDTRKRPATILDTFAHQRRRPASRSQGANPGVPSSSLGASQDGVG